MILYAPLFLWGNRNPEEAICAPGSLGCASWPRGETRVFQSTIGKDWSPLLLPLCQQAGAGLAVLDLATFSQSLTTTRENSVSFSKPHFVMQENKQLSCSALIPDLIQTRHQKTVCIYDHRFLPS